MYWSAKRSKINCVDFNVCTAWKLKNCWSSRTGKGEMRAGGSRYFPMWKVHGWEVTCSWSKRKVPCSVCKSLAKSLTQWARTFQSKSVSAMPVIHFNYKCEINIRLILIILRLYWLFCTLHSLFCGLNALQRGPKTKQSIYPCAYFIRIHPHNRPARQDWRSQRPGR